MDREELVKFLDNDWHKMLRSIDELPEKVIAQIVSLRSRQCCKSEHRFPKII